jgi:hypothetical protein
MILQPESPDTFYHMVWVSWWSSSQTLQTLPTTCSGSAWSSSQTLQTLPTTRSETADGQFCSQTLQTPESADDLADDLPNTSKRVMWVSWWSSSRALQTLLRPQDVDQLMIYSNFQKPMTLSWISWCPWCCSSIPFRRFLLKGVSQQMFNQSDLTDLTYNAMV